MMFVLIYFFIELNSSLPNHLSGKREQAKTTHDLGKAIAYFFNKNTHDISGIGVLMMGGNIIAAATSVSNADVNNIELKLNNLNYTILKRMKSRNNYIADIDVSSIRHIFKNSY